MLACPVLLFPGLRPAIEELLGERDHLALWTEVMVRIPIVDKTIGAALVGAVGRDETLQPPLFQKGIVLPATVARIGNTVLPDQTFFP